MLKFFGSSNIKMFVKEALDDMGGELKGKKVLDIPAGSGFTANILHEHGAEVLALDLFPEFFEIDEIECKKANLSEKLPIPNNSLDMIICQEGIEHLPDQLFALKEFNRVLKDDGLLLITTPNISHLRSKVSYLLSESDFYKRMPPNELDALWYSDEGREFYGHIFLINIQKLRVLSAVAGFKITKLYKVKLSMGSLFLSFLYPFIVIANIYAYFRNVRKKDGINYSIKKKTYSEIVKLNLHPSIQFGKHIFIKLQKNSSETISVNKKDEGII